MSNFKAVPDKPGYKTQYFKSDNYESARLWVTENLFSDVHYTISKIQGF